MRINSSSANTYNSVMQSLNKGDRENASALKNDNSKFDTFEYGSEFDQRTYFYNSGSIQKYSYTKPKPFSVVKAEEEAAAMPPEKTALQRFKEAAGSYNIYGSSSDSFSFLIKTGKKSVIMIDPEFLSKISDDPEKIEEYAKEIENMKRIDQQFERYAKMSGKKVISRGWYIDKDGGISSWSIVKTERKQEKTFLEKMNEYRKNLLKKKAKKKKEQQKLEEKKSKRKEELMRLEGKKKAAMKERLKRKAKKSKVIEINDLTPKRMQKKYSSISISVGHSPSLLDTKA